MPNKESISVGKSDIIWSYIAKFLGIASGLLVLPFILNRLTAEEMGLNYLMLTIGSMVSLLDFGFSPQFGRNITYVFSGAKELAKEGFSKKEVDSKPSYRLVATVIITAKKPHPKGKKTWFAYCRDDGFVKLKNKGRIDANHVWEDIKESWVNAYRNREVIDGFSVMREVNEKEEWCAEAYLETDYSQFTLQDYESTVKKYLMFHLMEMSGAAGGEEEDEDLQSQ